MGKRNKAQTRIKYWATYRRKLLKTVGEKVEQTLPQTETIILKPTRTVRSADDLLGEYDQSHNPHNIHTDEFKQEQAINRTIKRIFISIGFFLIVVLIIGVVLIIRRQI